eukprot:6341379-Prymnesium_polylepis.1
MAEQYASWSTADHAYTLGQTQDAALEMLGAAAGGGCGGAQKPASQKRQRELDLRAVLDEPLAFAKLPGSGAEQAPELLSLLTAAGVRAVHQVSPPGVAVFVDTAPPEGLERLIREHAALWLMCGLDPAHAAYEE